MLTLREAAKICSLDYNTFWNYAVKKSKILAPRKLFSRTRRLFYYEREDLPILKKQILAIKELNRNFFREFNERRTYAR